MIYESDRNMPLQLGLRESPSWVQELPSQEKAHIAIRNGDARLLAEALLDGAEINRSARPLLLEAATHGHRQIAVYLVDRGALLNLANPYGETAVHAAAQGGHRRLLDFLIEAGGRVNATDATGTTPLMLATFHGHLECASLLVESGADLTARDQDGASVLAHVRNGRAALEWKRKRALRSVRKLADAGRVEPEEFDSLISQDFEWLRCMDQKYREIRTYLVSMGATDCGTPVEFLTIPKNKRALYAA